MRPDVHAALVNLANTLEPDDDVERVIDELRTEVLFRRGFDVRQLRDAFVDASRRFWLRGRVLDDNQVHSIKVRHLRAVTDEEFREMAYGRTDDE